MVCNLVMLGTTFISVIIREPSKDISVLDFLCACMICTLMCVCVCECLCAFICWLALGIHLSHFLPYLLR